MSNRLTNAGFADGTNGWTGGSTLTVTATESQRGGRGRLVLRGVGSASAANLGRWLSVSAGQRVDVAADTMLEVMAYGAAFLDGVAVKPRVEVIFYDDTGTALPTISLNASAPVLALHGTAVDGLRDTFWRAYAVIPRPAGAASASLRVGIMSTAAGQDIEVVALKPYLGSVNARGRMAYWGPGVHSNTDLQRRNWPSDIPLQGRQGGQPKAWAVTHEAGSGLPAQRRISADPARKLTAQIRVDAVQRANLEAFAAVDAPFWLMEPESEKLCLASFDAEGAPVLTDYRGALHYMTVGLWLETY